MRYRQKEIQIQRDLKRDVECRLRYPEEERQIKKDI